MKPMPSTKRDASSTGIAGRRGAEQPARDHQREPGQREALGAEAVGDGTEEHAGERTDGVQHGGDPARLDQRQAQSARIAGIAGGTLLMKEPAARPPANDDPDGGPVALRRR